MCPLYDADTVYKHNFESNINARGGELGSCWRIERFSFNEDAVYNLNFDVYAALIDNNPDLGTVLVCIIYALLGMFLLLIGLIQNGMYMIFDAYYSIYKF